MKKIKYLLVVLSIFLIGIINVSAKIPETKNRDELENLGVNKKWNITDSNKANVLKTKAVNADDKIYDFSDVLTDEEYEKLKNEAIDFKNHTNMDIVILIDNLPYSYDTMNEDYAADFYDYNDFGLNINKYSGVLLFRNTYEEDPYYDIYTFGDAQLYFSHSRLNTTLDNIYNSLHNEEYYNGFSKYISDMKSYYDSGIPSEMKGYTVDDDGYLQAPPKKFHPPIILAFLVATILSTIVVVILIKKNKMIMKETQAEEYIDSKSINISNKEDIFITSHTTHYTTSSSSGGGGGGGSFHSSSGSSGGGHSSGGGRHG